MISSYVFEGHTPHLLRPSQGTEEDLVSLAGRHDAVWLNLENPSDKECSLVSKHLGIPADYLRAVEDINERPRMESHGDNMLVIIRAAVIGDEQRRVGFSTRPIAVILTPNILITVCHRKGLINSLMGEGKIPEASAPPLHCAALTLFMKVSDGFIALLGKMDEKVDRLEGSLQKSLQNTELMTVLHIEKALIYFLTALKGNQSVFERMRNSQTFSSTVEEQELFNDVFVENKQATDMAEIYSQIMGSFNEVFSAMVSNNLNKVMKVLTSLTIVFMVPSIIGALYGMNVPLPGQEEPWAFAALGALTLFLCFIVYKLLHKLDWM